jgi:hypothetical protein
MVYSRDTLDVSRAISGGVSPEAARASVFLRTGNTAIPPIKANEGVGVTETACAVI